MLIVVVDGVDDVVGVHEIVNLVGGLFVGRLVSNTSGIFVVVDYFVDATKCNGDDGALDGLLLGLLTGRMLLEFGW